MREAFADLEQCHSCRNFEQEVHSLQAENGKLRPLNIKLQEQLPDKLAQAGMEATRCLPLDLVSQDRRRPPSSSLQEDTCAPVDLGGSSCTEAVPAVPELPVMPTAPAASVSMATAFPDVPAETAATTVADCSLISDGQPFSGTTEDPDERWQKK
ncbi:hypothetical protein MRX96_000785 [Rhipicephalus microplus]